MTQESPPSGEAEQAELTAWQRFLGFLRSLAVLFAAIGGIAVVGGGLIFIWVGDLRGFGLGVVGAGAALLVLALASSLFTVRSALVGRRGRLSINTVSMVLIALSIVLLINFISFRSPQRLDTTFTQHFSLAPQTLEVLSNLTEPVQATAFFTPARSALETGLRQRADDLMSEYQRRSQRRFSYKFVDPELDPGTAAQYRVTQYPVIVFESQDSARVFPLFLPPLTEQSLTSSLLIVTGVRQKTIYLLTGHGEKDPSDFNADSASGFGFASQGIFADNYTIRPLNLTERGSIPEDAAVLLIAGPEKRLLTAEREEIERWLRDGGRALFLLDPSTPDSYSVLLDLWGIKVGRKAVVDLGSSVHQAPRTPLLQRNQYINITPITNLLDVTFFPSVTPVDIPPEFLEDPRRIPPWVSYFSLALTSAGSFATEDPKRDFFDQGEDAVGPHVIALAVQACSPVEEETEYRLVPGGQGLRCAGPDDERATTSIVVFGDSDFASNRNFYAYSNSDFLLNAVNWLAQDFHLISIRSKPFAFRELVLTTQEFNFIRYSSWFLLPAMVGLFGLFAWWRRR
jgi:ABC-type uncharacterized transport system involved in gliding motility auxiliary subunit